jgi:ferrochelatase
LRTITHYHDHPGYIQALVNSILEHWKKEGKPERLLFSFHGIPQSYAQAGDPYKDHCYSTASLVAEALGLGSETWQVAFQSRFGPQAWLKPYSDEVLQEWGKAGVKSVNVVCPGFSADCLETLYEVNVEMRATFQNAGRREFHYIPALNTRPDHIRALSEVIFSQIEGWLDEPEAKHGAPAG